MATNKMEPFGVRRDFVVFGGPVSGVEQLEMTQKAPGSRGTNPEFSCVSGETDNDDEREPRPTH
jgi:hypothetical protein